jgi:cytidylate kinase
MPQHCVTSLLGELGPLDPPMRTPAPGTPRPGPQPFVTISREPGAGGNSLARELADALNADDADDRDKPWAPWDGELVEKVAADYHLSAQLIERLDEGRPTSLADYVGNLVVGPAGGYVEESRVFAHLSRTIRALANSGRTVIVGRGAAFITRHLPQGIHLRLVAPFEWRVARMADELKLPRHDAANWVRQNERRRHAYIHRHWPDQSLGPESFTLTFNCARLATTEMVDLTRRLVLSRTTVPA